MPAVTMSAIMIASVSTPTADQTPAGTPVWCIGYCVLVIVYWLLCIGYCVWLLCIMLCYVILSNWCIVRMCRVV